MYGQSLEGERGFEMIQIIASSLSFCHTLPQISLFGVKGVIF